MTLADLLKRRPDLRPFAELMRAAYELHGMDFATAFNPAAEIHAGFNSTTNRMDEAA